MSSKACVISDEIFDVDYYVQRGGSLQSAINYYCEKIGEHPWERNSPLTRGHFGKHLDHRSAFIWLRSDVGLPVLTHECIHAANELARSLEITVLEFSDEFCAHYSAWLVARILKNLFGHQENEETPTNTEQDN